MKTDVEVLKTQMDELKEVILDLKQQANNDIWYDGADIKQLFNISDPTLSRYRKDKKIPFTKLGGRFLYPKSFFTKSLMDKMENKHLL
ncbi:MAG: helix-turn-helix domain-containing protein [Flavobacterium macrobrachii]|uniref:helix-turn-helix domain-containing protein n=1 Tax=Flavobacterium sp. TaxID=239 RepID=UPI003782F394